MESDANQVRSTASAVTPAARSWLRRFRLLIAAALLWAGLHYLMGHTLLPAGLNRPVTLAAGNNPIFSAIALGLILCIWAYLGAWLADPWHNARGLLVTALGLAAWAMGGGTMDDWLILSTRDSAVGPPSGTSYWPLVAEYLFLALVMAGVAIMSTLAGSYSGLAHQTGASGRIKQTLGLDANSRQRREGLIALLVTTVVIGLLMLILTGPAEAHTLRGQVYFAVVVSCFVGVLLATHLVSARQPIWYWPAPILAGLIGMLVAGLNPDIRIPAPYNQLNSIPAWGLARPLPIEMVGVGVAITIWTLRANTRKAQPEDG